MSQTEQLREQILSQKPTDQQRDAIFADELKFSSGFFPEAARHGRHVGGLFGAVQIGITKLVISHLSFTNTAIGEFHDTTIKVRGRELLSNPNYIATYEFIR